MIWYDLQTEKIQRHLFIHSVIFKPVVTFKSYWKDLKLGQYLKYLYKELLPFSSCLHNFEKIVKTLFQLFLTAWLYNPCTWSLLIWKLSAFPFLDKILEAKCWLISHSSWLTLKRWLSWSCKSSSKQPQVVTSVLWRLTGVPPGSLQDILVCCCLDVVIWAESKFIVRAFLPFFFIVFQHCAILV